MKFRTELSLSARTMRATPFQRKRYLRWLLKDRVHINGGSGCGGNDGDGSGGDESGAGDGDEGIPDRDGNTSKDTVVGKPTANVRGVRWELGDRVSSQITEDP